MKTLQYTFSLLLLICVSFSYSACRFSSPSIDEQHKLAEMGAFANGAPPWVARTSPIGKLKGHYDFGLIPQDYTLPVSSSTQLVSLPQTRTQEIEDRKVALRKYLDEQQRDAEKPIVGVQSGKSPLDSIALLCPGVEKSASAAITTVDINDRVKKLTSLTNQCSESADLWYWLGRDYARQGRLGESTRALQKAVNISPQHEQAKSLLQHIKDQQAGTER